MGAGKYRGKAGNSSGFSATNGAFCLRSPSYFFGVFFCLGFLFSRPCLSLLMPAVCHESGRRRILFLDGLGNQYDPYGMIEVVHTVISRSRLKEIAAGQFGDFVKAVVDVERGLMAVGGS